MMAQKMRTEHRFVRVPDRTLISPKITNHKMQAEGHCRMCGRPPSIRPLTKHHIIPASWFLRQPLPLRVIRNAHANVCPLCRVCHDMVDHRETAERMDSRRLLRRCFSQQEIAFVIAIRGKAWLDHHYPEH